MFHPPARIVAVIPAHNEAELLPYCLAALAEARARVTVPVTLVVVLDSCDDATATSVPPDVQTVTIDARNVGAARAAGFVAFATGLGADAWLATTDADSVVDPHWFENHLAHASSSDAAAGTVRIDRWNDHTPAVQRLFHHEYAAAQGNSSQRHVHGASLGVRADAYWSVGGFQPLTVSEDQDLVDRLVAAGRTVTWADDLCVATSDRAHGRADEGFAQHLRSLAVPS